jgi:hypothetical protein
MWVGEPRLATGARKYRNNYNDKAIRTASPQMLARLTGFPSKARAKLTSPPLTREISVGHSAESTWRGLCTPPGGAPHEEKKMLA